MFARVRVTLGSWHLLRPIQRWGLTGYVSERPGAIDPSATRLDLQTALPARPRPSQGTWVGPAVLRHRRPRAARWRRPAGS